MENLRNQVTPCNLFLELSGLGLRFGVQRARGWAQGFTFGLGFCKGFL